MSEHRRLSLVLTLVAAQLVVMMDSSILNVALPSIAEDLDLSATATAWVLNAYFLTFGGLLLVSGRAADIVGRRRMFLAGAAVLTIGSVVGALAADEVTLICARLLQGAGAAMLSPAAMSVILARFTGEDRTRTMSWWGAASTVGGALGVTVGGILTGAFGWNSVMVVTAAFSAAILLAGWAMLPVDEKGSRRSFDATGASLVTVAAVAVVYAVLAAPHAGLVSPEVIVATLAAVGAGLAFALVERRASDPVLPPSALRDARVSGGIVVNMLGGAARIACFVLVALLIQQVLRYAPAVAGLAMLPTSLAGFAVSTLVLPRVLRRFGPEKVVLAGLGMLVVAHLLFASIDAGAPYIWRVLPVLILAATGVAFSFTPTTLVIADGMAARNAGVSSGLASATAQIGGAIGIAVFGAANAAAYAATVDAGGTSAAAVDAGLAAAHLAAAGSAAAAILIAMLTFPALRTTGAARRRAGQARPADPR